MEGGSFGCQDAVQAESRCRSGGVQAPTPELHLQEGPQEEGSQRAPHQELAGNAAILHRPDDGHDGPEPVRNDGSDVRAEPGHGWPTRSGCCARRSTNGYSRHARPNGNAGARSDGHANADGFISRNGSKHVPDAKVKVNRDVKLSSTTYNFGRVAYQIFYVGLFHIKTGMTQSLAVTGLKKLIRSVELDLKETEPFIDNLHRFRALLWLESPDRTYVTDASGLCLIDPNASFAFFIKELTSKLETYMVSSAKNPVTAKLVLVICELVGLMPVQKTSVEINLSLIHLIQMNLDDQRLGVASESIRGAVKGVVRMAIVAGSNPIPTMVGDPGINAFDVLKKIDGMICSASTFRCLLGILPPLLAGVPIERRVEFSEKLYSMLRVFSTSFPDVHAEFVRQGLPQAQTLIDEILKWKGGPEMETLAVICYFIPMCHQTLEVMNAGKKGKGSSFSGIFSAVNDGLKTKKANQLAVARCFLELYSAIVIGGKQCETLFSPIASFLTKPMGKWELKLQKPKTEIMPEVLARLAAIKHAAGDKENWPLALVLEHLKNKEENTGWLILGEFLTLVGGNYPLPDQINSVNLDLFKQVGTKVIEMLAGLKMADRSEKTADVTRATGVLLKFLSKMNRKELLFSVSSVQDQQLESCEWNPNIQRFFAACPMLDGSAAVAKAVLGSFVSKAFADNEILALVDFLRCYWKVDDSVFSGVTSEQLIPVAMKFAEIFMAQADFCIKQNSPNLCLLPYLLYRFLKWAHRGLSLTVSGGQSNPPRNMLLFMSKTCFLLRAFTDDAIVNHVEQMITAIGALFGQTNPYIFPMQNISSDDSSMKEWTQTALSVWLRFVQKRLTLDKCECQIKQLIETQPQFDPTRERIDVVTGFLTQVIHCLSDRGIPGVEGSSLTRHFFDVVFTYLFSGTVVDPVFPNSFSNLLDSTYPVFFEVLKDKLFAKMKRLEMDAPFPYLTIIETVTQIIQSGELNSYVVSVIEEWIPLLFTIVQLDIFPDHKEMFVKSICAFVAAFYQTTVPKVQMTQSSTVQTLMELALYFGVESKEEYNCALLIHILRTLRVIFRNFVADISLSRPHIVRVSAEARTVGQLAFIVAALDTLLLSNQNEEVYRLIQDILNSILHNNAFLAWRIYTIVAKKARPVFRSLLIESLTLLCGMGFHSFYNPSAELAAKKAKQRKSSGRDSVTAEDVLREARKVASKDQPFVFEKEEELFDWLTEDNFRLFKNPPTTSPVFIQSAVACMIVFNHHNELFEEMAKLLTKESFEPDNPVSRFFIAWFKQMMPKESLPELINAIDPEETDKFFEVFDPPPEFTYYISRLCQLTNRELAQLAFEKSFLENMIEKPWLWHGTKLFTRGEIDTFMSKVKECDDYKTMLESIINAELIYPTFTVKTFATDRQVVLSFIGERPMSFDRSLGELFDERLDARQMASLNQANWVMDIGRMASGARGIFIVCGRVPPVGGKALALQFYLHFKDPTEHLEFFVDVQRPPPNASEIFRELRAAAPDGFANLVDQVTILNVSVPVSQMITQELLAVPAYLKAKVRFTNDLETLLTPEDKIFLPLSALGGLDERRGSIHVKIDSKECDIAIGFQSLIVATNVTCAMKPAEASVTVPFDLITGWEEYKDGSGMAIMIKKRVPSQKMQPGQDPVVEQMRIMTDKTKNIVHALKIIRDRTTSKLACTRSDVTSSVNPSFRVQMIAFALYLIAKHSAALQTQAIQLFEAAVRFGSPAWNSEISRVEASNLNVHEFCEEVSKMDIYEDVVLTLSNYVGDEPDVSVISLLKFFAEFMNRSQNSAYMSAVAANITAMAKNPALLPYVQREFFGALTSPRAVEATIPVIMKEDLDKTASRSIIQVILHQNDEVVSAIVVRQFLDGALRRRSFGSTLTPEQLFKLLPSLAFACPAIVKTDIARLLFCAVMGVCDSYTAGPDIKLFLEGVFATMQTMHEDLERQIITYGNRISKMLENAKVLNQLDLIVTVDKFTELLGPQPHEEYRRLLTEVELDDNPTIWYLKAAGMTHFGKGTSATAQKLSMRLKSLAEDENLGAQKLALAFNTLAALIEKYPETSLCPVVLLWAPLVSLCNRNTMLRCAACKLLGSIVTFALKDGKFSDFNGLITSQYISQSLVDAVDALEKGLMIKFRDGFGHAFVTILLRSLEEVESRAAAIELLKVCIENQADDTSLVVFFIVPLIAFGTKADLDWVMTVVKTECTTISELVFHQFEERRPREISWIIGFLCGMFGERHCAHTTQAISDTLIYGVRKFPAWFEAVRTIVVEKCWKMIDSEASIAAVETVAAVSAAFLSITDHACDASASLKLIKIVHLGDDSMKKTLKLALEGVDKAVRYVSS